MLHLLSSTLSLLNQKPQCLFFFINKQFIAGDCFLLLIYGLYFFIYFPAAYTKISQLPFNHADFCHQSFFATLTTNKPGWQTIKNTFMAPEGKKWLIAYKADQRLQTAALHFCCQTAKTVRVRCLNIKDKTYPVG